MLHSIDFLGRNGYTVYSIDYPLAPENKHPAALISVLKALAYVRQQHGVNRCVMFGDSAGGSLAATATALLGSKSALSQLETQTGVSLSDMKFPEVDRLLCLYPILDAQASFEGASLPVSIGLKFIYDCYAPADGSGFCFCSMRDHITSSFPKTLLMAGKSDPIYKSSLRGRELLQDRGVQVDYKEYPATHAFLGFPAGWVLPSEFRQSAVDSLEDILSWLADKPIPTHTRAKQPLVPWHDRALGFMEAGLLSGTAPLLIYLMLGSASWIGFTLYGLWMVAVSAGPCCFLVEAWQTA
eukprot:TRINITY_DN37756_c0_g1_i2.p1 TRINITY_DN37756_c0_g1~~TRINITY_DN37756_c0_g1_i2.p1  ORF type:complete len:297 (+),score=55.95 TRINITY_DN37756_c0_g1_i2:374-1264(+)